MIHVLVRRKALFALLLVVLLSSSLLFVTRNTGAGVGDTPFEDLRTVLDVVALVKAEYVDPTSASELLQAYVAKGSVNGMLQAVLEDPYTRYLDPRAYKEIEIDTTGTFAGIGIVVGMKDDKVTVIAPIENTPGWRLGLKSGDHITKINGRGTALMGLDEAVSLMRGKEGTTVTISVARGKGDEIEEFDVEITRAIIQVPSVPRAVVLSKPAWSTSAPIGYIRLAQFSERTGAELAEALANIQRQNAKGLILDLRSNPGGLLTAAIEVSDQFLSDGPIVHIVGREAREKQTYSAQPAVTDVKLPMVVLIDEWSASASEIVSGALQDRGVAELIGKTTFGKGLVQAVIPLQDGSALTLTTARYQTAGGRDINKEGVKPDVVVELKPLDEKDAGEVGDPDPRDTQLQKAISVLQGKIAAAKK